MGLFKPVKKPVIRQAASGAGQVSALRPKYDPKLAPCSAACPIGCDVRGWLTTLASAEGQNGDGEGSGQALQSAWQAITGRNPFPAAMGRLCPHPCEDQCHRRLKEGAVSVRALETLVGEFGIQHGLQYRKPKPLMIRVAVLGGGPAGLSAAYHLARRGYQTVVFERSGELPLPIEIQGAEVARIFALGVELKCAWKDNSPSPEQWSPDYRALISAKPGENQADGSGKFTAGEVADVPVAVANGLWAAEAADAYLRGASMRGPAQRDPVTADRLRLEWYKETPRLAAEEGVTESEAIAEAKRCMSCGMCMACGNCWMYCSNGGFEKLPSGKRYKLKLDLCNGCKKCADTCPSGYIEMS
jgi:Pyruvate/2-oxoacid:ferredoxin oxidoreductase delta subunit